MPIGVISPQYEGLFGIRCSHKHKDHNKGGDNYDNDNAINHNNGDGTCNYDGISI